MSERTFEIEVRVEVTEYRTVYVTADSFDSARERYEGGYVDDYDTTDSYDNDSDITGDITCQECCETEGYCECSETELDPNPNRDNGIAPDDLEEGKFYRASDEYTLNHTSLYAVQFTELGEVDDDNERHFSYLAWDGGSYDYINDECRFMEVSEEEADEEWAKLAAAEAARKKKLREQALLADLLSY